MNAQLEVLTYAFELEAEMRLCLQVQLLKRHETAVLLLDEIQDELDQVSSFPLMLKDTSGKNIILICTLSSLQVSYRRTIRICCGCNNRD